MVLGRRHYVEGGLGGGVEWWCGVMDGQCLSRWLGYTEVWNIE